MKISSPQCPRAEENGNGGDEACGNARFECHDDGPLNDESISSNASQKHPK